MRLVTGGKTVADYYLLDLMMSISLKWSPQLECTAFNMDRRRVDVIGDLRYHR